MAVLPPRVHTYHCICTSLLLATTHTLSTLPKRAAPSLDGAYILPVPSQPPYLSSSPEPEPEAQDEDGEDEQREELEPEPEPEPMEGLKEAAKDMPAAGYTLLLGMQKDAKITIIRCEDGFEKRVLWRCLRCALVVGYEITGSGSSALGAEEGEGEGAFEGKLVYLLPNGILGTDLMVQGKKVGEGDVEIGAWKGVGVWE
jgi:hypothetical protein